MSKFEVYFDQNGPVCITEDGIELDASYIRIYNTHVEIGMKNQEPLNVFREELNGVDLLEGVGATYIKF